jgi:hypothetical protein
MFAKIHYVSPLALMEVASPDLEKQGFFAVVFVNREIQRTAGTIFPEKAPSFAPYYSAVISNQ